MEYVVRFLESTEYFPTKTAKDTLYLHHTAGSHRPDWVIDSWNTDRSKTGGRIRIATAFVIGGKSTRNGNTDFDGKVYQAFSPDHWAHHLGVKSKNNTFLNQKSIGIEICNYGPLTQSRDGRFFTYVKSLVPESMVVELDNPFRAEKFYHAYTESQIESLRKLMLKISKDYGIDLKKGLKKELERFELVSPNFRNVQERQSWLNKNGFTDSDGKKLVEDGKDGPRTQSAWNKYRAHPFGLNESALSGFPGVWSHTNVRIDKTDIFPQKEMLQLIRSL